ncbi:MAG: sialate O-acetylesterase, partial [Candidatus Ornithomonoglobus sp.]
SWFEGDIYKGYGGSLMIDAAAGENYYFGYRKASTYVDSLTFLASESSEEPEEPTEDIGADEGGTEGIPPYESSYSFWDFDSYAPAGGGVNVPYISGNAEYDSEKGEIRFLSDSTAAGYLTIDFDEPIRNNTEFSFDYTGHTKALGNQFINYRAVNSEGEEIVSFSAHPYSSDEVYGSNTLTVCKEVTANGEEVRRLVSGVNSAITITTSIDYNSRKVTVTADGVAFTGVISESAAKDIAKIEISGTRSKTAAERYMSIDNLCVSEFESTEPAAPAGAIAEGYEEKTFGGIISRVNAPAEDGLPLVVYLSGKSRFGTDNYSQLYNAQYLFNRLEGKAVLAAPQTGDAWDADALKAYIAEAAAEYNTSTAVVAGQSEGADAAYLLAAEGAADKIIPIAGTADISDNVNAAVWAFGGFLDTKVSIADIRKPVNALQSAGANVRYTEYSEEGHNIAQKAAAETGLEEWILNDTSSQKLVDLVLFAGQSNMAGRGTAEEAAICPAGEGFELNTVGNAKLADSTVPYVLSTVTEPFGKNENNDIIHDAGSNGIDRRSGDMVPALMKAYYGKTGVPIVGVQASRGGQETKWFVTADVKAEMQRRYNDAASYLEKAGYTVRRKFMVWCQGEADADNNRSESVYKTNTLAIFDNMKDAGITDMFIVKTGHYNINYGLAKGEEPSETALETDERYKNVNIWQQELAEDNGHIYTAADLYTDSALSQMRDQYHYYQPVYNEIGTTAGEAIAAVYENGSEPTENPPAEKPTDTPGVSLSWDFSTDQTASEGDNV